MNYTYSTNFCLQLNKDLRDRVNNMQPSQVSAFNQEQIEKNNNPFRNYIVPNPEDCTEKIYLKGPFRYSCVIRIYIKFDLYSSTNFS